MNIQNFKDKDKEQKRKMRLINVRPQHNDGYMRGRVYLY